VLGLAFKHGTDDLRESSGLKIIDLLLKEGVTVSAFDPLVKAQAVDGLTGKGVEVVDDMRSALQGVDACILATRDDHFADIGKVLKDEGLMGVALVDGRRLLDPDEHTEHEFRAVGL
jgi:UDPglucose 6-dehydrogenase